MVKLEKRFDLNVLIASSESEAEVYLGKNKGIDLININNPEKEMIKPLKGKGYFYVPNKITYYLKVPSSIRPFLNGLRRNRRKKIVKSVKRCSKEGVFIIREEKLTENNFVKWLELYNRNIEKKVRGQKYANLSWFEKYKSDRYALYTFLGEKLIGGIISKQLKRDPSVLSISYSATDKDYSKLGITEYLNLELIKMAIEQKRTYVERGVETNFYGHHLSPGLVSFKISLGYDIAPNEKYGRQLIKILDFSKFGNTIFFLSYDSCEENCLIGNLILKDQNYNFDQFSSKSLKRIDAYTLNKNGKLMFLPKIKHKGYIGNTFIERFI